MTDFRKLYYTVILLSDVYRMVQVTIMDLYVNVKGNFSAGLTSSLCTKMKESATIISALEAALVWHKGQ